MQKAFRRLSALQRLPFSTVSSTFSNGCNNYIKLSNGVRVVSDPVQGPFCAGGLYIPYGSRHEHPERELGACYLYEKLGLKQTMKSSPQQIHQKLEKLGYSVQVSLLRDGLLVSGAVLPYQFEELLSFLSEVILWPKFDKEDGEKCREIMDFDLLTLKEKPETLLTELTHYFMYPPSSTSLNSGLRNGLLKWEIENLKDTIQVPNLETFLKRIVQPQNMIVGVAGLSAEQIAPLVEKYFGHLSASLCTSNSILEEKAKSQSGLFRYESKDLLYSYALSEANMYTHYNHFQVSFPSFNHHEREIFPQAVLTSLLGGGSSFSAGGPGKGLFSRLYRNLLNRYGFIEAAYATEMSYSDVGYFATQGSCEIGQEENTFRYLVREVCRMMPSSVANTFLDSNEDLKVDLSRAKNRVSSQLLMSLENRLSQLENLVRTVAYENRIVTREELLQGINQVSIQELIHTSYSILNNRDATPTIVMVGADLKTVPSYEKLLEIYLEEKRAATSC